MSYSCLEELQVDLDLYTSDKTLVLSKVGCKYNDGWLVVTDDGNCYLFDKGGNLDDIKKVAYLNKKHIRKDITKIVIPDSVTSIGEYAFYNCSSLMGVMIPDSVTRIEDGTFRNCSSLTNVTIPDSMTSIGWFVFAGCRSLTSVMIGNGVMSIGEWTFLRCNTLTNLIFKGKTLEQVKKMKNYTWWGIKDKSIIQVG